METTLKEFITYLQALPEDTELYVLESYDYGYSTCVKEVRLNLDESLGNIEFIDLTDNPFVKADAKNKDKKYLTLGKR